MPVGEEEREEEGNENGMGCSAKGEITRWVLLIQGFYLSLEGRNLRVGLRGGFQQNIFQFSRCFFRSWSLLIG